MLASPRRPIAQWHTLQLGEDWKNLWKLVENNVLKIWVNQVLTSKKSENLISIVIIYKFCFVSNFFTITDIPVIYKVGGLSSPRQLL